MDWQRRGVGVIGAAPVAVNSFRSYCGPVGEIVAPWR